MASGRSLPDEPRAMQHSILLLHALLGGLQEANHILQLLVVHLTPRGTLLEREGERGRREGGRGGEKEEGGREKRGERKEGGRERSGERGGREGEEGGGGIHVKCVHGITCLEHTSHNQHMYMSVMH